MKNKTLIVCIGICICIIASGCGQKENTSSSSTQSSTSSVSSEAENAASDRSDYSLEAYELDGVYFAVPKEWSNENSTDNTLDFLPRADNSVVVQLRVENYDSESKPEDYMAALAATYSTNYSNSEYQFVTEGERVILVESHDQNGIPARVYNTIINDKEITMLVLHKSELSSDEELQLNTIISTAS